MTRYRPAFSWDKDPSGPGIQAFLDSVVTERPLLNVCSGTTAWGDVRVDLYEPSDLQADWTKLPFARDSFGAVFADPPWNAAYKEQVAAYMREALRVASVAYLMAPWLYCSAWTEVTGVWYREFPGIHVPVLLTRYQRPRQLMLFEVAESPEPKASKDP